MFVADVFKGRARAALPAVINGHTGAVWAMGGQVRAAFVFSITGDKITGIDVIMTPGASRRAPRDDRLEFRARMHFE
jgi:hypothetical protein